MKTLRNHFDYEEDDQSQERELLPPKTSPFRAKLVKNTGKITTNMNNLEMITPVNLQEHTTRKILPDDNTHITMIKAYQLQNGEYEVYQRILDNVMVNKNQWKVSIADKNQQRQKRIDKNCTILNVNQSMIQIDEQKRNQLKQMIIDKLKARNITIPNCAQYTQNVQDCDSGSTINTTDLQNKNIKIQNNQNKRFLQLDLKDKNSPIFKDRNLKLANTNRVLVSNNLLTKIKQKFQQYNRTHKFGRLQQVAYEVNLSIRFIYHLWHQWQKDPTLKRRMMANADKKLGRGRDHITDQRLRFVQNTLLTNPRSSVSQITQRLNSSLHLRTNAEGVNNKIKFDTVLRYIKELGFIQLKNVDQPSQKRNFPEYIQQRQKFGIQYIKMKRRSCSFYYFYWQPLCLELHRKKCWIRPQDHGDVILPQSQNLFFFAVLGPDKCIHHHLELCDYQNFVLVSNMRKLVRRAADTDKNGYKKCIFLENEDLYFNQTYNFQGQMKKQNLHIYFYPPYSNLLNPIKEWFNIVKRKLSKGDFQSFGQLLQQLKVVLDSCSQVNFQRFIDSSQNYIDVCLKGEKL